MSKITDLSVQVSSHAARVIRSNRELRERDRLSIEAASEVVPPTSKDESDSTNQPDGTESQ